MKKKVFYFSYKSHNENYYWGFGIDLNAIKARVNGFITKLISFIAKLILLLFYFVYALCFFGLVIFGSELAEGRNKGGNLIAFAICAGFICSAFSLYKRWKQKIVA